MRNRLTCVGPDGRTFIPHSAFRIPHSHALLTTAMSHLCSTRLPATIDPCCNTSGEPSSVVTTPPVSRTSTTPAATSHGASVSSQKPSRRPAATSTRSSAAAPDAARGPHHGGELIEVASQQREILERESGADEGLPRIGEPRDLEPALALPCAESARAPVHAISRYIVHHADVQRPSPQRPDRHRALRIPVQEVGRAVDRAADPHHVAPPRDRGRKPSP